MATAIVDTSALIFLARIGRLELLESIGAPILPKQVHQKFESGRVKDPEAASNVDHWIRESGIPIRDSSIPSSFHPTLGKGERAVLYLGRETSDSVLIIDERVARRHAKHSGLRTLSTPYLLLRAAELKRLSPEQALLDLDRLVDFGYFLDPRLYAMLVVEIRLTGKKD